MKTLRDWNGLREFGINCLTGEACAMSARLLCDVTEDGRKAVCEFLGLPLNTVFAENWNSGSVGSVFLPYSIFNALGAFLLLTRCGCDEVFEVPNGLAGMEPRDLELLDGESSLDFIRRIYHGEIGRRYYFGSGPRRGASNVHAATGRSQ